MFLKSNSTLQDRLHQTIQYFTQVYHQTISHFERIESASAIQAILIPEISLVKKIASGLQQEGFDVRPILSPTVAEGRERLRICLHNYNTNQEIDQFLSLLSQV